MSGLIDVAIQQFADQFDIQFQASKMVLSGAFKEYRGLMGDSFKAPVIEEVLMQTRGAYNTNIPAQIPANAFKTISFENYVTNLPIDDFEKFVTNANVRAAYSQIAVNALNRTQDQVGIDTLEATTTTNEVAVGTTNLPIEKIREAAYYLDLQNVPSEDRYWIGTASQKKSLLGETETTSSDYAAIKALVQGQIDSFYGFKFIWIGNRTEGGLTKTVNSRVNFAWHKSALAFGYQMNPTVVVERIASAQSWSIFPKVRFGAAEILPKGIVKITCDESAA